MPFAKLSIFNRKSFILKGVHVIEKNLNVIHIIENTQIDLYNKEIWPNVINKRLFKNVYVYKLKKRGQMIKFGNNTTNYFN